MTPYTKLQGHSTAQTIASNLSSVTEYFVSKSVKTRDAKDIGSHCCFLVASEGNFLQVTTVLSRRQGLLTGMLVHVYMIKCQHLFMINC